MSSENNSITIVTIDNRANKGIKNQIINTTSEMIYQAIDKDVLEQNLRECINNIGSVLNNVNKEMDNYNLDEVEVSLQIDATGSVNLIGGLSAGVTGGITLKFKRRQ